MTSSEQFSMSLRKSGRRLYKQDSFTLIILRLIELDKRCWEQWLLCQPITGPLWAREMEKVFGYLAHTPQRHQGMVLGLPRVSSLLRCGKLQLFSSRSRHFLQGAWYHQHYPNLYANPWLLIEHYFMRRSYARRLLRINSVDLYGRIIFICYWYVYSMISTSLPLLVSIGECSFVVLLEHLFWAMKFKDGKDILMIEWIKTSDRVSCIVYI